MSAEVKCLQLALESVQECYEELVERAELYIDGYWVEWKERNKQIAALGFRPGEDGYIDTGRLAPRLKQLKSTHRVYIEWWDWKKTPYRKFQNASAGIQIKRNKSCKYHYTWERVSRHANEWERIYFDKYEPLFANLRKSLSLIADQITLFKKLIRQLSQGK